jgi:hypothetical protein
VIINEQAIIDRLKQTAPFFNGNVAGITTFNPEVEATRLPLPAAYVGRDYGEAAEPGALGPPTQIWVEYYTILVCVSNAADTLGEAASGDIRPAIMALFNSLIGWAPDPDLAEEQYNVLDFVRDDPISQDRARIYHSATFKTSSPVTSTIDPRWGRF